MKNKWLNTMINRMIIGAVFLFFFIGLRTDFSYAYVVEDYTTITEKIITETKTKAGDLEVEQFKKFTESDKEGIGVLIEKPVIIKDDVVITEQTITDLSINFGTEASTDVYPYHKEIDGELYTGILNLQSTEHQTKNGSQTLYDQKKYYDYKINVVTAQYDNQGQHIGTSYSWDHTNNHPYYYDKNDDGIELLYVKESAERLNMVRNDHEDGSYTIEETWQGKYFGIIEETQQVVGTYQTEIGYYSGTLKKEEHFYTYRLKYFAALLPKEMMQGNLGDTPNAPAVNDPVNIVTGNFYSNDTDLEVLDIGMTIQARRYYNALDEREGMLGKSWRFHYDSYLEEDNHKVKVIYPNGRTGVFFYNETKNEYEPMPGFFDQLTKETDGTYTLTLKDNTKYIYNTDKQLSKILNVKGNALDLIYNVQKQLIRVQGEQGKSIALTYEQGKIKTITDTSRRTITYDYDHQGLLEKVMDVTGAYTAYTYENDRIKTIEDKNGAIFITNTYDKFGWVTEQIDGNGGVIHYTYDIQNKQNTYHDMNTGEQVTYHYNKNYYVTKIVYQDGSYEAYTYDSAGNKKTVRNRNGQITTFDYDDKNQVTSIHAPAPYHYETKISYDDRGNVTKIIHPNGVEEKYTYDMHNNLITIEKEIDEENKAITTFDYDTQGRKISQTNPLGDEIRYEYSGNHSLPTHIIDAEGHPTTYTYDEANRVKTVKKGSHSISYDYNHLNNITKVIDQSGNTTRMKYDRMGNLIKTIEPNQYNSTTDDGLGTVVEYNAMDKPIKTIDPLGNIYAYQYDTAGNLTKAIHPNAYDADTDQGEGQSYIYDVNHRLIKTIDPNGKQSRIKYDPLGHVIKTITASYYNEQTDDGEGLTYQYDELNRVKSVLDKEGTIISKNIYDETGNVIKTVDDKGYETLYQYNKAGWLIEIKEPLKKEDETLYYRQTKYSYDLLGRVTKEYKSNAYVTKNGNAVAYTIISYTYNKNNQIISVKDSTGANSQYKYNDLYQLIEQKSQINDTTYHIKKYQYDELGQLIKEVQTIKGSDLGSEEDTESAITQYAYDKNGNLIQVTSPLGYITRYTYDANNRVTKKEEEVDEDWLQDQYVKASIYSPRTKGYENNQYTYKVTLDTTESLSELNLNIKYDPRLFDIEEVEKPNDKVSIDTDTLGKISIKSTNQYAPGKTDLLEINLRTKTQSIGMGYLVFEENSTYNNVEGQEKPLTELTGQRLDMTGPDINQNHQVEINDLTLTAKQINNSDSLSNVYKYDTNNDGIIDTTDLNYISEWLNHDKSHTYKHIGINQSKNKIIHNSYTKGTNKVIRTTTYSYDKAGNCIQEIHTDGIIDYTYDLQNNLIKHKDKEGNSYRYHYDSEGNLIQEIKPENYNESTDSGKAVTYTYDYLGRLTLIKDEENQVIQQNIYDIQGQLIEQSDAKDYPTQYTYDIGGRLTAITTPEAREKGLTNRTYSYDAQDHMIKVTDAKGYATTYIRDSWGRIIGEKDAKGNKSVYTYDYAGNVTSSIDPKGNKILYTYNSLNQLKEILDPKGQSISYTYDKEGRVIEETDRLGQTIHYQYNSDHQLTHRSIEQQEENQCFLYNLEGSLFAVITNQGIEKYTYNNNGLIKDKILNNERQLSYDYNKNSQIKSIADYAGKQTSYQYDLQGRIQQVNHDNNTLAAYTYHNQQLAEISYNNGIKTTYTYNKDNQVKQMIHSNSTYPIHTYTYSYDANGDIIEKQENGQKTSYSYDELGQLIQVTYPNQREESYHYDIAGNRQERLLKEFVTDTLNPVIKETRTTYQYNALNQLTKAIENDIITTYQYDKNGNLLQENHTSTGTTYYQYDGYNRLINITQPDGSYQSNYYSSGNLRTAIEENGQYTGFTYHLGQVVNEHTSHRDIKRTNIVVDTPIALIDENHQAYYYLNNVHGDITTLTNTQGQIQNTYQYDAFGSILNKQQNIPNRHTYAGEQYDTITKQYYLRARYYNPRLGRFTQEDSYRGDGLNLYAYVANNPVMYVDPSGYGKETAQGSYYELYNPQSHLDYIERLQQQYEYDKENHYFGSMLCDMILLSLEVRSMKLDHNLSTIAKIEYESSGSDPQFIKDTLNTAIGYDAFAMYFGLNSLYKGSQKFITSNATKETSKAGVLDSANFAQKTYRSGSFSDEGIQYYSKIAGRDIVSVDDLVGAIKSGEISPSQIPIDYVVRDGNTLILNTRSSQALTQAGIPRSQWNAVNRTGQDLYEGLLTGQLTRNKLTSEGISTVRPSNPK